MRRRFVIAGTDTGVGKTIFSAALADALGAVYWKPVQAGLEEETDSQTVLRLSGLAPERVAPEAWRLRTPASPHIAARIDGVVINVDALEPPACEDAMVIETAGGLMTPLTPSTLTIDVLARWGLPTILVARTTLGTINHSLLSIEALRRRNVPFFGLAFVGDENSEVEETIATMGAARRLGRLPYVASLTRENLQAAFGSAFRIADFDEEAS
jgi:dethiobiotin synthetase